MREQQGMEPRRFEIGGRVFFVRRPVMGQLELVGELLARLARAGGEGETPDTGAMLAAMGGELSFFLAVVLVEEGQESAAAMAGKDIRDLAAWLQWEAGEVPAAEIAAAFFTWPGLAEMVQARNGARGLLLATAGTAWRDGRASRPTSGAPSSSSPGATSSSATPCAGESD